MVPRRVRPPPPLEPVALRLAHARSKLSSAHVYLRQPEEQPHGEWDKLPAAIVDDLAQLVKANSIEGMQVDYRA